MSKKVLEILQQKFGAAILETHSQHGDDTAVIEPSRWREVAQFLRDDPRCAMNQFMDLCGVDYLGIMEPRFEVVVHLRSLQHGHRLRIKTRVGEEDGSGAEVDSLITVWRGVDWFEREAYDLMGIVFRGHPDLRRILMYPEFVGHPLRKDFPANKIQPLVPFREGTLDKLPPFSVDEGMPFGRQTHDRMNRDELDGSELPVAGEGRPLAPAEGPPGHHLGPRSSATLPATKSSES